jgi:hypothetical protein
MRSAYVRRTAMGAALVAALFLTTGCDNPIAPDAASVGDTDISRDSFLDDAHAFASLDGDPYGLTANVDTNDAYAAAGMAELLRDRIIGTIIDDAAERFDITADDAELAAAEQQLGAYTSLPDSQREFVQRQIVLQGKVLDHVGANQWWNDDDIERYAEELDDDQSEVACVRHILVETQDEADDIVAELRDGGDFATLAEERSIDTASGQQGGDLGCQPAGSFIAEFEDAFADAEDGDLIGPVETSAGFHVILVDSAYHRPSEDEVRAVVESRFASGADGWVDYVLRTTDIGVDRRYGSWDSQAGTVTAPPGAQAPTGAGLDFEL